jgi:hypothetical protein
MDSMLSLLKSNVIFSQKEKKIVNSHVEPHTHTHTHTYTQIHTQSPPSKAIKKSKVRVITLLDFKIYYKAILV